MRIFIFCICGMLTSALIGQHNFYFEDKVYSPDIKTINFGIKDVTLSEPIVYLNSNIKLELTFDDLGLSDDGFIYDIIHCDRNWNPSDLDNIEYLEGFTDEEIEDYDNSVGTIVDYVHYRLTLPNEDLKWTLSGNYLLVVKEDNEDMRVVLTRRFMVVDSKVKISQEFQNAVGNYNTHQEIDFIVDMKNQKFQDPQSNFSAIVLQNYRWDNAIMDIKPRFIDKEELVFDYSNKISFPGLKEFRSFDTRTLFSTGYNINAIELNELSNDVILELTGKRVGNSYHTINDANGQFVCYTEDHRDAILAADYTNVVFALKSNKLDKDVHVVGLFNDYKANESNKLYYDEEYEAYFGQLLLKQGYYDFMYCTNDQNRIDISEIEGSWFETENDYAILVYYHSRYLGYDQLIGFSHFNYLNK